MYSMLMIKIVKVKMIIGPSLGGGGHPFNLKFRCKQSRVLFKDKNKVMYSDVEIIIGP